MPTIARENSKEAQTVTAEPVGSIDAADAIDVRPYAGGKVYVPAGATAQVISIYGAPTEDGTYLASKDKDGNALTLNGGSAVAASEGYELPHAVYAEQWIKLVAASSQQTGLIIALKS